MNQHQDNPAQILHATIINFANSIQAYANSHGYYVTVGMHHLQPRYPYHPTMQQVQQVQHMPYSHPVHLYPQQPTPLPIYQRPILTPLNQVQVNQAPIPLPIPSSQTEEKIIIKKEPVEDDGERTETDEESQSEGKESEEEDEMFVKPKLGKYIQIDIQAHRNNTRYQCVSQNPIHVKIALEQSTKTGQCVKTWLMTVPYNLLEGEVREQIVHMYQIITDNYVIFTASGTSLLAPFVSNNCKNTARYLNRSFVSGLHYSITKVYNGRLIRTQIVSPIGLENILAHEIEIQFNYASALQTLIQPHFQIFLKK
jgi:hypothetical protein